MKSRVFSIIGIAGLAVLAASTGAITGQETDKGRDNDANRREIGYSH